MAKRKVRKESNVLEVVKSATEADKAMYNVQGNPRYKRVQRNQLLKKALGQQYDTLHPDPTGFKGDERRKKLLKLYKKHNVKDRPYDVK